MFTPIRTLDTTINFYYPPAFRTKFHTRKKHSTHYIKFDLNNNKKNCTITAYPMKWFPSSCCLRPMAGWAISNFGEFIFAKLNRGSLNSTNNLYIVFLYDL